MAVWTNTLAGMRGKLRGWSKTTQLVRCLGCFSMISGARVVKSPSSMAWDLGAMVTGSVPDNPQCLSSTRPLLAYRTGNQKPRFAVMT